MARAVSKRHASQNPNGCVARPVQIYDSGQVGSGQLRMQNEPPPIAMQLPDGAHCEPIVQRSGAQKRTVGASAGVIAKPRPPT
jgi:hypothetical protein